MRLLSEIVAYVLFVIDACSSEKYMIMTVVCSSEKCMIMPVVSDFQSISMNFLANFKFIYACCWFILCTLVGNNNNWLFYVVLLTHKDCRSTLGVRHSMLKSEPFKGIKVLSMLKSAPLEEITISPVLLDLLR